MTTLHPIATHRKQVSEHVIPVLPRQRRQLVRRCPSLGRRRPWSAPEGGTGAIMFDDDQRRILTLLSHLDGRVCCTHASPDSTKQLLNYILDQGLCLRACRRLFGPMTLGSWLCSHHRHLSRWQTTHPRTAENQSIWNSTVL